ncbi:MAG: uroporphyrinogen-III synthase [Moritella sp.]|jgi:uroporphyrinogen-III synthase
MKVRALITRPATKGEQLVSKIKAAQGFALSCPFIDITAGREYDKVGELMAKLHPNDYIIAISDNAVNYASASLSQAAAHWPQGINYIAVGPTTAQCWHKYGVADALVPENHDSEGVLKLLANTAVADKNIIILRGNGGRETMAKNLRVRAANVYYCEVYQRSVPYYEYDLLINNWQHLAINSVIITSGEILGNLMQSIPSAALSWITNLHFIVPSQRIADIANAFGINHVIIADGASNNSLFNAVKQLDMQIGIS